MHTSFSLQISGDRVPVENSLNQGIPHQCAVDHQSLLLPSLRFRGGNLVPVRLRVNGYWAIYIDPWKCAEVFVKTEGAYRVLSTTEYVFDSFLRHPRRLFTCMWVFKQTSVSIFFLRIWSPRGEELGGLSKRAPYDNSIRKIWHPFNGGSWMKEVDLGSVISHGENYGTV